MAVEEVLKAAEKTVVMVIRDTKGSRRRNGWILAPPEIENLGLG